MLKVIKAPKIRLHAAPAILAKARKGRRKKAAGEMAAA
jgi:hypothetical protein